MATELKFTKEDGVWIADVVSPGTPIAVEVNRTEGGPFLVKGSVGDLKQVTLRDFGPRAERNLLFEIDVPESVNLHFISYTEVKSAKTEGA